MPLSQKYWLPIQPNLQTLLTILLQILIWLIKTKTSSYVSHVMMLTIMKNDLLYQKTALVLIQGSQSKIYMTWKIYPLICQDWHWILLHIQCVRIIKLGLNSMDFIQLMLFCKCLSRMHSLIVTTKMLSKVCDNYHNLTKPPLTYTLVTFVILQMLLTR